MNELLAEHRSLIGEGRAEDALRLSGEGLARAEAALRLESDKPDADKAKIAAVEDFLAVASLHLNDINHAGLFADEAALAVSVPATLLMMKLNPETIGEKYVYWLLMTVGRLGDIIPSAPDDRLAEPFCRLAALAVATCDDYALRMTIRPELVEIAAQIRSQLEMIHPEPVTFGGEPIRPQMAIDILFDLLSAMASLGWIGG